jgi:uncharacterized protein (DUF433 family)/DNA-binding HxlR family transcriptional regulator
MKTKADQDTLVRCLLELIEESRYGHAGCSLQEIDAIMVTDRGVEEKELQAALRRVQAEGLVQAKDQPEVGRRPPIWRPESRLALTTGGKSALRELHAMAQFNVRAPQRLLEELGSIAHQGETPGATALRLMEEGIRMEKYPGISFKWVPSGRRPFVLGTSLSVWEIYHIWQDFDRNADRVAKAYPYLKAGHVNVAISYAQACIHEMPVGEWGEKPPFVREIKV